MNPRKLKEGDEVWWSRQSSTKVIPKPVPAIIHSIGPMQPMIQFTAPNGHVILRTVSWARLKRRT